MKVVITGAYGFIGWHVSCFFSSLKNIELCRIGRQEFHNSSLLDSALFKADLVIHLAGVNRGRDEDVFSKNVSLAKELIRGLLRTNSKAHLFYSNSTHHICDSHYGRGKSKAADIFNEWANQQGCQFSNLILPHIFGECGRPFYNSVVSTFSYKLANGELPKIDHDGDLELLHASYIGPTILNLYESGKSGLKRMTGVQCKVSEFLERITALVKSYQSGIIPDLRESIDLELFNTYRSYLYTQYYPKDLVLHTDSRGSLFEAAKSNNGGQCFISTTKPGVTRGNHFHFHKVERFLVVQGNARVSLRKCFDDRVINFIVNGDEPQFIDIPTLHTHNITNIGDTELLTLFWSHEIFDPEKPDTFVEEV